MYDGNGAWVFVSHSNHDLRKVRLVRNKVEELGHNPILFFLKSLSETSELDDLIRREILARDWFLLCDSEHARNSKWVQQEIEIVRGDPEKVFETIDLEDSLEPQWKKIEKLTQRATVFLSYARQDRELVQEVANIFRASDYRVGLDSEAAPGSNLQQVIGEAIKQAIDQGFVLVFLSSASLSSDWVRYETEYALELSKSQVTNRVVPVLIEKLDNLLELPLSLRNIQYFDLTLGEFEPRTKQLISHLKSIEISP